MLNSQSTTVNDTGRTMKPTKSVVSAWGTGAPVFSPVIEALEILELTQQLNGRLRAEGLPCRHVDVVDEEHDALAGRGTVPASTGWHMSVWDENVWARSCSGYF